MRTPAEVARAILANPESSNETALAALIRERDEELMDEYGILYGAAAEQMRDLVFGPADKSTPAPDPQPQDKGGAEVKAPVLAQPISPAANPGDYVPPTTDFSALAGLRAYIENPPPHTSNCWRAGVSEGCIGVLGRPCEAFEARGKALATLDAMGVK